MRFIFRFGLDIYGRRGYIVRVERSRKPREDNGSARGFLSLTVLPVPFGRPPFGE